MWRSLLLPVRSVPGPNPPIGPPLATCSPCPFPNILGRMWVWILSPVSPWWTAWTLYSPLWIGSLKPSTWLHFRAFLLLNRLPNCSWSMSCACTASRRTSSLTGGLSSLSGSSASSLTYQMLSH
uniref:Uncharacterized protein n=1 Tax=Nothobranchius korthausae TaxID=1143690 RepID=A0A1A8F142_9TELE